MHPKKHERAGSDQRWKILQTLESAPKLINLIKKLRWIGMEEEAARVQVLLQRADAAATLLAGPWDTD